MTLVAMSYTAATGHVLPGTTGSVPVTAKASVSGTISQFAIERAMFVLQQGFLTLDPVTEVTQIGDKVVVTAHVKDAAGNGVPNIQVLMTVQGGGVLETPTLGTDSTGKAVFTIDTSQMGPVKAAFLSVSGSAAGPGFTIASSQLTVPLRNPGPAVFVGAPLGSKVDNKNVTLQASATSRLGFTSVSVKLDSGTVETLVDATTNTSVTLMKNFGTLANGTHTILINATDGLGVSTESSVTFTVVTAGGGTVIVEKKTTDTLPWVVAAIGWILFVIVAVMMMMRGRKPKQEVMAPAEGEVNPPPEKL